MKKIIISVLFLIPVLVFAQENKKIMLGLNASPDYCYRSLKPDNTNFAKINVDLRNENEIPKIGSTLGFSLIYRPLERFSFETGILYSNKGFSTKALTFPFDTLFGSPVSDVSSVRYTYNFNYLDIPLKASYFITDNKNRFYGSVGISANIFLSHKTHALIKHNDGKIETRKSDASQNTYNTINPSLLVAMGVEFNPSDKIMLRLEPVYRRSLTSIIDKPVKPYLYSIGLNLGLYYKLK